MRPEWRRGNKRLLFVADYLRGRYAEAMTHYPVRGVDALAIQALLHLDRADEAKALVGRRTRLDLRMRVERPLSVRLAGTTSIPFADHALAPWLTAVPVTLDGHGLTAVVDTGGPYVVMGVDRAAALGFSLTADGRRGPGFLGMARELAVGAATLTNVPIRALPALRDEQDVVVIGTGVLQQFLATIDHPAERLVLAPRGTPSPPGMPFHLWDDHYMFARGGLGDRQDLNFFIDTGLAYVVPEGQACLYATSRQYRSMGVRANGPHFAAAAPVRLGPLSQEGHVLAVTPGRRAPWSSFGGVRIDGLLSNAFFRRYTWTLNFDRHEYSFGRAEQDASPA